MVGGSLWDILAGLFGLHYNCLAMLWEAMCVHLGRWPWYLKVQGRGIDFPEVTPDGDAMGMYIH